MSEWESLRPDAAVELLRDLDVPWWIAGGWSLDLFLGYELRPHEDLDVAVLRRDHLRLADNSSVERGTDGTNICDGSAAGR